MDLKRIVYIFTVVFYILCILSSCSANPVLYPYDIALEKYLTLPENKELKRPSELIYKEFYTEKLYSFNNNDYYGYERNDISELISNGRYIIGINKFNYLPFPSDEYYETEYLPCIYYKDSCSSENLFSRDMLKAPVDFRLDKILPVYYNPRTGKYEDTVRIKKVSDTVRSLFYCSIFKDQSSK
jgi:hypothetical protein